MVDIKFQEQGAIFLSTSHWKYIQTAGRGVAIFIPKTASEAHWAIRRSLSRCKSTNGLDGFDIRRSSHQTLLLYRLSKHREMLSLEVRIKGSLALVSSSSAKTKIQTPKLSQLTAFFHYEDIPALSVLFLE
jgi:hypothetical protein